MQPVVLGPKGASHRAHVVELREIAQEELDAIVARRPLPLRDDPLTLLAVARGHDQGRTSFSERPARGLADPLGRAGHEEDFSREVLAHARCYAILSRGARTHVSVTRWGRQYRAKYTAPEESAQPTWEARVTHWEMPSHTRDPVTLVALSRRERARGDA